MHFWEGFYKRAGYFHRGGETFDPGFDTMQDDTYPAGTGVITGDADITPGEDSRDLADGTTRTHEIAPVNPFTGY